MRTRKVKSYELTSQNITKFVFKLNLPKISGTTFLVLFANIIQTVFMGDM